MTAEHEELAGRLDDLRKQSVERASSDASNLIIRLQSAAREAASTIRQLSRDLEEARGEHMLLEEGVEDFRVWLNDRFRNVTPKEAEAALDNALEASGYWRALSPQTEEPYTRTVKDSPGTGRVTLEAAREAARRAGGRGDLAPERKP